MSNAGNISVSSLPRSTLFNHASLKLSRHSNSDVQCCSGSVSEASSNGHKNNVMHVSLS